MGAIITRDKTISYNCAAQLFFFIFMGVTEFYILTAMSYDRYVAICKPLHYTTIMSRKLCSLLVLCAWLGGFLTIFPPLMLLLQLDYCASNVIDHFACDYFPLLQLSCSDTWFLEIIGFCFGYLAIHFGLSDFVIYVHYQDYSENPICQSEKKGLLHLFLSHDCHLHLLWKLYIHVC